MTGFIVANSNQDQFRFWGDSGPEWTPDQEKALRFARRVDAEQFCRDDEDAWHILEIEDEPEDLPDISDERLEQIAIGLGKRTLTAAWALNLGRHEVRCIVAMLTRAQMRFDGLQQTAVKHLEALLEIGNIAYNMTRGPQGFVAEQQFERIRAIADAASGKDGKPVGVVRMRFSPELDMEIARQQMTADLSARLNAEIDRLADLKGIPRDEIIEFAKDFLSGKTKGGDR